MPFSNNLPNQPELLNWQQFAELFAEQTRRDCGAEVSIEWGEDLENTTLLVAIGNARHSLYLGNQYALYCQEPADLEAILAHNSQIVRQTMMLNDAALHRDNIMPVIKSTAWLDEMAQSMRSNGDNPDEILVYEPLAENLLLAYVFKNETFSISLDRLLLAQAGISEAELQQTALDNLSRYSKGQIQIASDPQSGLNQILFDGTYDASLILLLGDVLAKHLPDNPVFALPTRDALFACSPDNPATLDKLQQLAAEIYADSPYAISPYLYQYHNGEISLFQPH